MRRKPYWFEMVVESVSKSTELEKAELTNAKLDNKHRKALEKLSVISGTITDSNVVPKGPANQQVHTEFADMVKAGDIIRVLKICVSPMTGLFLEIGNKCEIWDEKDEVWNLAFFQGTEKFDKKLAEMKGKTDG